MATTFDAPTGESCVARRDVSNSPLQALTLLNDAMFMEAAVALGKAAQALPEDDDARLTFILRRCVTRPPSPEELALFRGFLQARRASGLDAKAVWTAIARAALNLDESITHP